MRPQDPDGKGKGWWFQTSEHGGDKPDNLPQAITARDAEGRWAVYVPLTRGGRIVIPRPAPDQDAAEDPIEANTDNIVELERSGELARLVGQAASRGGDGARRTCRQTSLSEPQRGRLVPYPRSRDGRSVRQASSECPVGRPGDRCRNRRVSWAARKVPSEMRSSGRSAPSSSIRRAPMLTSDRAWAPAANGRMRS
jgi:hypothetical protein